MVGSDEVVGAFERREKMARKRWNDRDRLGCLKMTLEVASVLEFIHEGTVSEVHDALIRSAGVVCCRRTTRRNLVALEALGIVARKSDDRPVMYEWVGWPKTVVI